MITIRSFPSSSRLGSPRHGARSVLSSGLSTGLPLALALALSVGLVACSPGDDAERGAETATADAGPRDVPQYTIDDFLDTKNYAGGYFSPDGQKLLLSSDASGVWNVYEVPAAGGEPTALTESTDDANFARGYFPNDERIVFTADRGGDEQTHIYVRELDGTVRDLTPGDGLKASFAGFTEDDRGLLVESNERDARYFDLYVYDVDTYERELLYQNEGGYQLGDLSPDRGHLLLAKINDNADSDAYLHTFATGETRHLTPHEGDVLFQPIGFDPSGDHIYLSTDRDSEFQHMVRMPVATLFDGEAAADANPLDALETVFQPEWDLLFARFSESGKYLIAAVNRDARTEIHLLDAESFEAQELPELPDASIQSVRLSNDEQQMAFWASTSRTPNDLFVTSLDGDAEPRQLTHSLSSAIDPDDLVDATVARFDSFDGVEIPGVLYMPHAASEDAKVPGLVMVHGGPGGQSRVGYDPLLQFLVNHGYAVYAINNRGSSGYGKTFFHMDDRNHGKGDLQDCVASKGLLTATGKVDPERIGIIGGSYGGYMVLAALAFEPEEFDVGVNIFGVSNWVRTLQSIPPWWEAGRKRLEKEMGSFDDTEYLTSISPLFHADNIVRPLMVLQGANDPRVLQVESDEIVEAVRANDVPVEYIVFDDEGHGFRKKENQEEGYEAIRVFLDRYLKGDGAAEMDDPAEVAEAA